MPAKRDLVIHYNEETEEIEFFSTDVKNTEAIRKTEFGGVRIRLAELRERLPDDAEQAIGQGVLSLVELNSNALLGIGNYKAEADQAHNEYVEELERNVAKGNIDATYSLAIEMHASAIKSGSLADLDRAESLFDTAARAGHQEAARTVTNWADLRGAALGHIDRRRNVEE